MTRRTKQQLIRRIFAYLLPIHIKCYCPDCEQARRLSKRFAVALST